MTATASDGDDTRPDLYVVWRMCHLFGGCSF